MENRKDICPRGLLLFLTLGPLAAEALLQLVPRLPEAAARALKILIPVLWALLWLEQLLRMIRMGRETRGPGGKDARQAWVLLHKAELAFFVLTPLLILPRFTWLILLKLPYTLGRYDDERVFQHIVNGVAVILIVIFVVPFLHVIASAFSGSGTIVGIWPVNPDLYSVKYVLADRAFGRSVLISILITAVGTTFSVLAMTMAAYPLSKPQMPFRRTMMIFFMICMLFSGGMAPKILLMNSLKLNNTLWALILPIMVNTVHILLLKGFFEDVPEELEESAKLDGARNYTILFRIIVPVAAPMIATVVFSKLVEYWNNIETSVLYITSNQSIYPLPMYIRNVLNQNLMELATNNPTLRGYWDHVKMSYILLSILPIVATYPFIFRYLKKGVAAGAVKG